MATVQNKPTPETAIDHGQLEPEDITRPPKILIPQALRNVLITVNMPYIQAVETYGLYEVIVLKPFFCFGKVVRPGDRITIPGNTAKDLAINLQVKFNDAELEEEENLRKKIAELERPVPVKDRPEFAPRKTK
jgi:hypothetical protein